MARVLVIAAHPDDETIGASALLGRCRDGMVIHVTDGAPRDPRWWPAGVGDRAAYALARSREVERALAIVGTPRLELGFTDQEATRSLPELIDRLCEHFVRLRPAVVVTHAYEGGHPDHDAIALAVAVARTRVAPRLCVLEMALYHAGEGSLRVGEFLPGSRSLRCVLRPDELERRREMLACFTTQQAIVAPFVELAHERYRVAPTYDFSRPPHEGLLHYERVGFPLSGAQWRESVARARGACP